MRFESFIALRYLFSRKGNSFIGITSALAMIGVALGVGALIVVMGVMNGFTIDMRDKIIGVTSHAIVFGPSSMLTQTPPVLETILSVPGVTGVTPFIYGELMLSSREGGKGVIIRGIDPTTAPKVLGVLSRITEGSVANLAETTGIPGIIVGQELARKLNLAVGSRVNMLAPSGEQSSTGFNPKIKTFKVVGIFSIGMFEYDMSLCFISLASARDTLGWPPDAVTGLEVAVDDIFAAQTITDNILKTLDGPYSAQTWMAMNGNFFAALKLEKAAMAIILGLIVVVGAFSIITALVMLVMEKTRDIAILMSMGATKASIRRIFIIQGALIGGIGTVLGFALGLACSVLLEKYQFVQLPPGVYSLDRLPVLLEWPDLVLTGLCAMLLCFCATLYPSFKAASLEPVEALRQE